MIDQISVVAELSLEGLALSKRDIREIPILAPGVLGDDATEESGQ